MNKEQMIAALKKMRDLEEESLPVYIQHLDNTFFLSDFKPSQRASIRKVLERLSVESRRHAVLLNSMIQKVQNAERDVY